MNTIKDIHLPTQTLYRVFSLLSLLLVIYACFFSWKSWREEKKDQIHNMQNIIELGEKATDAYFTQLQNSMLGLRRDIMETGEQIDIDRAYALVKQFKESRPELINVTFIREDGQILFTAKAPPSPQLPTLAAAPGRFGASQLYRRLGNS